MGVVEALVPSAYSFSSVLENKHRYNFIRAISRFEVDRPLRGRF